MSIADFRVSVIIPVYNAALFVRKAVESANILDETGEILLIEDGSPDNGLEVCMLLEKEFSKVKCIQHPDKGNHGAAASRNLGIISATSNFIAFLDADDYYLPNRFSKDKEILIQHKEIEGVYNALGIHYYTEKGKAQFIGAGYQYQEFYTVSGEVPPDELFSVLFNQHPSYTGEFHGNTITVRKEVFEKTGLFKTNINIIEDTHLWRRMAAVCKLAPGNIQKAVAIRGVHDDNRMIDKIEQSRYYDLWWSDLNNWLVAHHVSKANLTCFKSACLNYQILHHSFIKTIPSFANFFIHHARFIKEEYGLFDTYFFNLFGRHWLPIHLISLKNKFFGHLQKKKIS